MVLNYINVKSFKRLFNSLISTNEYPYSISEIANIVGFNYWQQLMKYQKIINQKYSIKNNNRFFNGNENLPRYSNEYLEEIKKVIKRENN